MPGNVVESYSAGYANVGSPEPPYASGTTVTDYQLYDDVTFVRFTGPDSKPIGGWVARPTDVMNMTPEQAQETFSLPNTPTGMVEVHVAAGNIVRVGIAGANGFAPNGGGGTQIQLISEVEVKNNFNKSTDLMKGVKISSSVNAKSPSQCEELFGKLPEGAVPGSTDIPTTGGTIDEDIIIEDEILPFKP